VPAPRGAIFDRNGELIADNVPGYALSFLPAPRDSIRRKLEFIAPLLGMRPERVEQLMTRRNQLPGQPLVVANELSFDQVSALEERRVQLPGMVIEMQPKRHYPAGDVVAHLVGYVGEISETELARPEYEGAVPGQVIGKAGLERQYESLLGGRPGARFVEVDARGRIVGEFEARKTVEPTAGQDLHLFLDLDLQRWIAHIFPDTMKGALVAIEPGTGHVLAMYSNPGYDPNDFVGGISPSLWRQLNTDQRKPLLHRSTTGLYPPGSTFKLFTAALGLELGVVDPKAYMPIPCRGGMQYGNRYFRCWYRNGHGALDMAGAIQNSCNVYFYQLGLKIGLDRMLEEATRLGFSTRTGIDLPVERAGNFPNGPQWYKKRFGWAPTPTEVLSLAIGQGANDQSPLKMAQLYAALGGDGTIPPPRLAAEGPVVGEGLNLHISKENLATLREGMRRVTAPGGTAGMSALEHWDFVGKTGTSQNPQGADHGWFTGLAGPKGGEPEIAIAAIVEHGLHGSTAAQYAAKAADYYLRRKHGMAIDSIQTLREHMLVGRPTPWAQWR
jgi:penicillin-binding protein 2